MSEIISARAAFHAEKPHEQRLSTAHIEARSEDDGTFVVEGYASITGAPYDVTDWMGTYTESVSTGAFTKSLNERDDVRWLINHDGIALARTGSGTLDLKEIALPADDPQGRNQTGLWTSARLDGASPLAQTVRSAIERGDMSQMSFAFQATRQEWNEDYTQRTINETRLFDVSAVTYPANPATSVGVAGRSIEPDDLCIEDGCTQRGTVEVPVADDITSIYCREHAVEREAREAAELEAELRRRHLAAWKARNAA
jgi:HK97 family phage prohead protease